LPSAGLCVQKLKTHKGKDLDDFEVLAPRDNINDDLQILFPTMVILKVDISEASIEDMLADYFMQSDDDVLSGFR